MKDNQPFFPLNEIEGELVRIRSEIATAKENNTKEEQAGPLLVCAAQCQRLGDSCLGQIGSLLEANAPKDALIFITKATDIYALGLNTFSQAEMLSPSSIGEVHSALKISLTDSYTRFLVYKTQLTIN